MILVERDFRFIRILFQKILELPFVKMQILRNHIVFPVFGCNFLLCLWYSKLGCKFTFRKARQGWNSYVGTVPTLCTVQYFIQSQLPGSNKSAVIWVMLNYSFGSSMASLTNNNL